MLRSSISCITIYELSNESRSNIIPKLCGTPVDPLLALVEVREREVKCKRGTSVK